MECPKCGISNRDDDKICRIWATDINTDIVAIFHDAKMSVLGYFYQGEYHLREK